jgi:hypothetical protein
MTTLATTPYSTQSCINGRTIRFFTVNPADHASVFVSHADLINALDLVAWSQRLPSNSGEIYGGLPEDFAVRVLVAGSGYLDCIPILQATTIAAGSPRIGVAQQTLQSSVLTALVTGTAALP